MTTPINLFAVSVCVWYRSPKPDKATVQLVMYKLQDYNINDMQLVDWVNKTASRQKLQQKKYRIE